jgi:hypothetical protein
MNSIQIASIAFEPNVNGVSATKPSIAPLFVSDVEIKQHKQN